MADVLAGDAAADLTEILVELDASLAEQERSVRQARERIAQLQGRVSRGEDVSTPAALSAVPISSLASGTAAELDRDLMSLLPDDALAQLTSMFTAPDGTPLTSDHLELLYRQMDELSDAAPDDPRGQALAEQILTLISTSARRELAQQMTSPDGPSSELLAENLSPAQLAVVRRVVELVSGS